MYPSRILSAVVLFIVAIALFVLIFGSYVEIKIYKNIYIEHGKRIALLNAIGESSDLIMKDSNEQPKKLIFLENKLNEIEKDKELSCCYYYNYDYFLEIRDLRKNNKWEIGFDDLDYFLKKGKFCNVISKKKYLGGSSIPLVIFNGTDYNPGVGILTLGQTPLSNIAYGISVQCLKNEDSEFETYIYGIDSINILEYDDNKEICIKYMKDKSEKEFCKKISCDKKIEKKVVAEESKDGCYKIIIKKDDDKIEIYYPSTIQFEIKSFEESGEIIAT